MNIPVNTIQINKANHSFYNEIQELTKKGLEKPIDFVCSTNGLNMEIRRKIRSVARKGKSICIVWMRSRVFSSIPQAKEHIESLGFMTYVLDTGNGTKAMVIFWNCPL